MLATLNMQHRAHGFAAGRSAINAVPAGEVLFEVRVMQSRLAAGEPEPAAADEPRDRTALATRQARSAVERQSASPEPVGTASLRYRNAFISYSRKGFRRGVLLRPGP
jgi:hypothetical protein